MPLPIRTTLDDIDVICTYLASKPTGASTTEAKAILDTKYLDGRKLNALRFWGFIEESGEKIRLTEDGRQLTRDKGARRAQVLRGALSKIPAYRAIVERALHRREFVITATEIADHWHRHFKSDASDSDKVLNDQAVCFFQMAQGADLGVVVIGRKGQATRFEFDEDVIRQFVEGQLPASELTPEDIVGLASVSDDTEMANDEPIIFKERDEPVSLLPKTKQNVSRVFITHGKNRKILDQVKEIVSFGKFDPVVAQERETAAKPVPDKVMDEMRECQAAVIHVGLEGVLLDKEGNEHPQINGNVLIEIGAAMALYNRNFILLVEEGVKLPSNLQGLYECRYKGDELGMEATMKLLKAFNQFSNSEH